MRSTLILIGLLIPWCASADEDIDCMAEAIYYEARDQSVIGQLAIGVIIKNRKKHPDWPNTICGVVRQGDMRSGRLTLNRCQFSYYCDGLPETPTDQTAWELANNLARLVVETDLEIDGLYGVTHYHATYVTPSWLHQVQYRTRIGQHRFYIRK
jgi:spore germination cell wall hydrolase CwlJ-like protein